MVCSPETLSSLLLVGYSGADLLAQLVIQSEYNPQGLAVCGAQHYSLWLTSVPCGASRVVGGQTQGLWALGLDSGSALFSCGQAVDKRLPLCKSQFPCLHNGHSHHSYTS